jgi:hypothetical protein
MFVDANLKQHFEESSTIRLQSKVIAEINMNSYSNIKMIGNYRYRPLAGINSQYGFLPNTFDITDAGNFYTGATLADVVVDGGYEDELDVNDDPIPALFMSNKQKEPLLFSLEECFGKFRPRSGINKLRLDLNNGFTHHSNINMARRPRYYMADRSDKFKYWSSYRTESDLSTNNINIERGIANQPSGSLNYIDDAAPFVVYNEDVPANRVVVKLQTNVGDVDLGPFSGTSGSFADPLYGTTNQTTPSRWKIQGLKSGIWTDLVSFSENSKRDNGSSIIGPDGYVEISFGHLVPDKYKSVFIDNGIFASKNLIPKTSTTGQAYLIKSDSSSVGEYYVWYNNSYESFVPEYGWQLANESITALTNFAVSLVDSPQFYDKITGKVLYREFDYLGGLRLVAETMNKFNSTLDLIELSPRLAIDLSDKTQQFSITKSASDLGLSGMPVGQLLASTGTLQLFDYDEAFNQNNTISVIANHIKKSIQVKFYEEVRGVEVEDPVSRLSSFYDYYIPIKTMYVDGFPMYSNSDRSVSISLRDQYFYFESTTAPQICIQNVSLSYAVSLLLDNIGFSNYVFYRNDGESDPIIPFFYIGPDKSVAEVLQDLAVSTQTAMFFDEYNNFVMMSRDYIMPSIDARGTDLTLYGTQDDSVSRVNSNGDLVPVLTNIAELSFQNSDVYNDGLISYVPKYIQKTYGTIKQAYLLDRDKTWIYKPTLLWEVSGTENTKSINESKATQSDYTLSAIPLNSDLTDQLPVVVNHKITNNIIDLGEAVYWLSRYNGYFYANGEIIKYDAVEYNVSGYGNVWITNIKDYQDYFGKVGFNGKIYPTGLVRLYSEPNYEVYAGVERMVNGAVSKHGRMQFGTGTPDPANPGKMKPVLHNAGLSTYWRDNANVRGCQMKSKYIFGLSSVEGRGFSAFSLETQEAAAGVSNVLATKSTRTGIIKNFLSSSYATEADLKTTYTTDTNTVQSSALVMTGPSFEPTQAPIDFLTYVYKPLSDAYRHFGTRMRVIGRVENSTTRTQTANGAFSYVDVSSENPEQSISIAGGGGGIAVMLNPETNNGYYFEIAALTEGNVDEYNTGVDVKNVIFYKIVKNVSYDKKSSTAVSGAYNGVTLTGSSNGTLSINSESVNVGQRIFLENQGTGKETENGYYVVTDPGSSTSKWVLTRDEEAIPVELWSGLTNIIVDSGKFTGQSRVVAEDTQTVYDLAVEYQDIGKKRRFFLYLNGAQVATVDDETPLRKYNNMALFVRGSSKCMFENLYALTQNYSQDTSFALTTVANSAFGDSEVTVNESFRKYSMSGMIQSTYLSGISPSEPPKYNIYFEEFGTIMREATHFNVRYDKAYPALYAKLAPTFNSVKGYSTSGFFAGAYGAEFLVFNSTDTVLSLDSASGNYLRILGITFTQDSQNELTVDSYFSKESDRSNPVFDDSGLVSKPLSVRKNYEDIKKSRMTHGKKEFSLSAPYIQSQDAASDLMGWMISKIMQPRKSLGLKIFANPMLQLGDIVEIFYKNENDIDEIGIYGSRFVVYNIQYTRDENGPSMTIYVSEVI